MGDTDGQKDYKIVSLKFVVYDNGNIAVLSKTDEDKVEIKDEDVVMVYKDNERVADAIPTAIAKLSGTPVVADKEADNGADNGEGKTLVAEEKGAVVAPGDGKGDADDKKVGVDNNVSGNEAKLDDQHGGSRRAYPKNVSFSKKYPKNKSNKKTLRNLQRKASH